MPKKTDNSKQKKSDAKKRVMKKAAATPKSAVSKTAKKSSTKAVKKATVKKTAVAKSAPEKTAPSATAKPRKTAAARPAKAAGPTPKIPAAIAAAESPSGFETKRSAKPKLAPLTESGLHALSPDNPVVRMESTKYHPAEQRGAAAGQRDSQELPESYGDTKLTLMTRDPEWIFAYWEIGAQIRAALGIERFQHNKRMVLRFYDVTGVVDFTGINANDTIDVEISDYACSWYFKAAAASRKWCADLGLLNEWGEFVQIARSNHVHTPANTVSNILDEEWMVQEEAFRRLLGATAELFAPGSSDRDRKLEFQITSRDIFRKPAGWPSSPGLRKLPSSPAGGFAPAPLADDFFLEVGTEVILYGKTQPDANVTIQGKTVYVNPDGTFHVHMTLDDGKLDLPVRAKSKTGSHQRQIEIDVTRDTSGV